ncbi:adenylate kinase 9 isoform X3 [Sphaerodactylus townsendi]|uniref:adenylate kinase 9 isoform X3 n=1 Tax=Sphaerodactylus townsendi TaxID=933632 RepID=UPI002026E6E1|nr:adenylate kinase 9 isoform X3 [Sphaerodactylus townsendi]
MMSTPQPEQSYPFVDLYGEDEADKAFLMSKPTCFLVLGKPGVGKKTFATKLAQIWKCTLIDVLELLDENISASTAYGLKIQELLFQGQSIPEELIVKMLLNKIETPEVAHFGYVLCDFPSLSEEYMTITEQIEIIRNFKLKPDFLINIKCPDYDLCQRLSGQRQLYTTGQIFQRDEWDPEIIEKRRKKKKSPNKSKEEEEEAEEEEEEEDEAVEAATDQYMLTEILPHLVQRPEDFLENVQQKIEVYRDTVLHPLEELMAEQDSQYLIELDGNKSSDELFTSVIAHLQSMGLRNGALITRLQSAEEEIMEGLESDEIFRTLAAYKLVAPRYRWRRSRWGRACPVALKDGRIVMGSPDFAVSFLGKMYTLSTEEALNTFMLNPRPFLLPPMPLPPCKVLIIGPPFSGRSTLCQAIANYYTGKVLDMDVLLKSHLEEARLELIEQTRSDATAAGIAKVKEKIEMERLFREEFALGAEELTGDKELEDFEESFQVDEESSSEQPSAATSRSQRSQITTGSTVREVASRELSTSEMEEQTDSALQVLDSNITADHPEVQDIVNKAIQVALQSPILLPPEMYSTALQEAVMELTTTNKNRFLGAPLNGGWVVDNFPPLPEYWSALTENDLLPDILICLKNTEQNGKLLLNRLYMANKDELDAKILKRLMVEALKRKQEEEETRKELQEMLRLEADESAGERDVQTTSLEEFSATEQDQMEQPLDSAASEGKVKSKESEEYFETEGLTELHSSEQLQEMKDTESDLGIKLPEFPEDGFPDVLEMEPLKNKISHFMNLWQKLEPVVTEAPLVQIADIEIEGQTPEMLLDTSDRAMKRPLKYQGWEIAQEDEDEEQDDLQAETEALAEEEEEEEEEDDAESEEEEDEEKVIERKRRMGDTKHFCPVILKENFILYPGSYENGAKYQDSYYYFSTSENRDKFLENPDIYVSHNKPLKIPPLRVCLLGSHGSGKTVCARWLANKLGIFHIQFEERLQELIMLKTGTRVGPETEEEDEEEAAGMQEMGGSPTFVPDSAIETEMESEDEKRSPEQKELQLTDEEEAIKANLAENEPLPAGVLENVVSEWWTKEPFRSTGFILDGFPRTVDEAAYLAERGLCPDIVVYLEVEEDEVSDRILPTLLKKWQDKQNQKKEKKQKIKEEKAKIREDQIIKRRIELLAMQAKRRQYSEARLEGEVADDDEEEEEEEEDDIEAVLEEEFPKEEDDMEDEDEEQESEAIERLKTEIAEKFEMDLGNMQAVQEELEKILIPQVTIGSKRKPHIVCYQLYKKLKDLVENRESLFEKCYPLSVSLARKMITLSYKHPSNFGEWDPIKLSEGDAIKPYQSPSIPSFPVIHRNSIYFFASKENRDTFMKNPIKYIRQLKPKSTVPVKIAIVGPPKSGKTTVAKKFASVYGLMRLSMGDAIRMILSDQPDTELALMLKWHLHKGLTAPDELAIQALDIALMSSVCITAGVVIDGYPVTRKQVNLLEHMKIIPVKIFEMQIDAEEVFRRALLDKQSPDKLPYPLHDSSQILSIKNSCYRTQVEEIRAYYEEQHQNWYVIDALHSKWWIWDKVLDETQKITKQIQMYLERIRQRKAASIAHLCITPQELLSRLGDFGQYCPVSLAEKGELVDCSVTPSLQFAAEFRGHYYKMAGQEELDKFLNTPELYVPPLAPHPLPLPSKLPQKLTAADVKALFPMQAEMQGYCPVTYLDGKQRYEALVPGNIEYAALYRKKLYIFESEEKLQKFMRSPEKYWKQTLPHKLPPKKEPVFLTALPLTGYLEQGVATALIKAMNEVGCLKPKFPFLSVKKTALLFIAYHLKAFNPRSSDYMRKKYKRKLDRFIDNCELIPYLGTKMTKKYKEPPNRPIDFDHKLHTFLSLKGVDPTSL